MGIQEKSVQEHASDEISLFEIWAVLVARKRVVLGVTAAAVTVAILFVVLAPRVFVSVAELALGEIRQGGNVAALESADELTKGLLGEYGRDNFAEKNYPLLAKASIEKARPNVIHLEVEGEAPAEAQAHLNAIVQEILADHNKRLGAFRSVQEQALTEISLRAEELRMQLKDLERELSTPRNKRDATEAAVIQLMRATLVDRLASLEARKSHIEMEMTEIYARPTRVLMEPRLPQHPAKPRKQLILFVAAFFGLLAGVVAALIAESVAKRREGRVPASVQVG